MIWTTLAIAFGLVFSLCSTIYPQERVSLISLAVLAFIAAIISAYYQEQSRPPSRSEFQEALTKQEADLLEALKSALSNINPSSPKL